MTTACSARIRRFRGKLRILRYRLLERRSIRFTIALLRRAGKDDLSNRAASLAYYAFISLFPLLLGLVALFSLFLPPESVQQEILRFFARYLPGSVGLLENSLTGILRYRGALGALGIAGLFWSASAVFSVISQAINKAWDMEYRPPLYIKKPREMAMALGTGVLFLSSIGTSAMLSMIGRFNFPVSDILVNTFTAIIAFLFSLAVFCLLYKAVPITWVSWRLAWPGALFATVLFEAAKTLFVFYLNHYNNYDIIYGPLASVIALLVWIYYSAFILILGAEFCAMLSRMPLNSRAPESMSEEERYLRYG